MSTAILEVKGLTVRRGDILALEDLSFHVQEGEVFGLLGPNGSGKSTTFSVLAGLLRAQSGALHWRGEEIRGGDKRALREVGFVGQSPSLDPNLSARENLKLSAALHRVPRAERADRIEQMLQLAELVDRADELVSTFSGGMKRSLDIARALLHNPKVLILDEPTTGLDEGAFQRTWRHLLEQRAARGLTILLSTHRPEEAAQCDRIAFIDSGRVVACDSPAELQRLVSDDKLTVRCAEPAEAARQLSEALSLELSADDSAVTIKSEAGHELIPRIVEALPSGSVEAIQLSRPNLGDVFLHLTGASLSEETKR